jgi:hypothetical protein
LHYGYETTPARKASSTKQSSAQANGSQRLYKLYYLPWNLDELCVPFDTSTFVPWILRPDGRILHQHRLSQDIDAKHQTDAKSERLLL